MRREVFESLELNCRTCKAFDAVETGGMEEKTGGRGKVAEQSNIDGEWRA
jgi:hypothetical protein